MGSRGLPSPTDRAPRSSRSRTPLVVALLAILGACGEPTASTRALPRAPGGTAGLRLSLANGVAPADSARIVSAMRASRPALAVARGAAAEASVGSLCGIGSLTLPRGVVLLPEVTETDVLTLKYSVEDARDASQPSCGPSTSVVPASPPLLQSSFPGRGPQVPITVTFDSSVARVSAYSNGALTCVGGQYGSLIAYDSANVEVARANMQLMAPLDCGDDSLTFGVYSTVSDSKSRIRSLTINPPQPWVFPVFLGEGATVTGYVTAQWILVLPWLGIVIDSVAYPIERDSSFTTLPTEQRFQLRARANGVTDPSLVQWLVKDDTTDRVKSGPPITPDAGLRTSFEVLGPRYPNLRPDTSRWVAFQHPGELDQKALAYRIVASVATGGESAVQSPAVIVRQKETDVMRQEYIDFGITSIMPPRGEILTTAAYSRLGVRHFSFEELTRMEDYTVAFLNSEFLSHLDDLRDSVGYALTISSGFRNPVHHRFHLTRRAGDGVRTRSNHQSGNAADIDVGRDSKKWNWVGAKAKALQMCVEPVDASTLDHVHVDWRGGRSNCPPRW